MLWEMNIIWAEKINISFCILHYINYQNKTIHRGLGLPGFKCEGMETCFFWSQKLTPSYIHYKETPSKTLRFSVLCINNLQTGLSMPMEVQDDFLRATLVWMVFKESNSISQFTYILSIKIFIPKKDMLQRPVFLHGPLKCTFYL
jgi:hypothetical protein